MDSGAELVGVELDRVRPGLAVRLAACAWDRDRVQQHEGEYGPVLFAQHPDAMFGQFIGDVVGVGGRVAAVDLEQHAADTAKLFR